jgi:hypothetical protein
VLGGPRCTCSSTRHGAASGSARSGLKQGTARQGRGMAQGMAKGAAWPRRGTARPRASHSAGLVQAGQEEALNGYGKVKNLDTVNRKIVNRMLLAAIKDVML